MAEAAGDSEESSASVMGADAAGAPLRGWAWWESIGAPRYVCAPMVDQSERAFRLQVRRHGVGLCYSPMLLASAMRDGGYARTYVDGRDARDRPLVVQIGGCDAAEFVAAARAVEASGCCDAIDVNLGCPQSCARRGGYGAFLEDDDAVALVRALTAALGATRG